MYQCYRTETEMAEKALKTIVFLGSVREGRFGLRVAKFVKKQLEEANHKVEIFDPAEMQFPILTKAIHHYSNNTAPPAWMVEANKKLLEADAVVVVSAEYNHAIPPALSNMMDHFPGSSYAFKPSGIVCYSMGPFGGMRAAMQLRCFLGELGCLSVSNIFGIPHVNKALDEDGQPTNEHMVPGAKRLIAQLDWHAHAMRNHRQKHGIPS